MSWKPEYGENEVIKTLIENDKPIPGDLKGESDQLLKEIQYDDINTQHPNNIIDDEYYDNLSRDPKILVTTSRAPTQRLTQFLKEMRRFLLNIIILHLWEITEHKDY